MFVPIKLHELESMRRSVVRAGLPKDQQERLIETCRLLLEHPFADDA